ncbi:conjugal transfer protein TraF [Geoalkalibacter halelectricus]|uniref:conjugal transfer protein TraF n=1 Tax=Geoalkalibacter halelectricus TaxID=2847045 RepID=UPI003D2600DB
MFLRFFSTIWLLLLLISCPAQSAQQTWWDRSKEGWFWYEDPPESKEAQEEDKRLAPLPPQATALDYTPEELWDLHPEQFQQIYTNTLNAAVQKPTPQNVEAWYEMQDIARRKSVQFANVAQYIAQTNPSFNYVKDSPHAAPGRRALYQQQFEDIETHIARAAQNHGLLFFYSSRCGFCEPQAQILRHFSSKYHWEIKGVDVDLDPALAARFNVQTTPTVMLVNQQVPTPFPVAVGVVTLTEMERNIYRGMRILDGSIDPTDYSLYEFQRGSTLDSGALMRARQPQGGILR